MIGLLLICGLATGILSSFFGVGGGIIMVPVMYFLFPEYPATLVIGTSLSVICINGLLNTYLYYKKKTPIKKQLLYYLAPGMVGGAYIGSLAAKNLDLATIKIFLATILMVVGIRIFLRARKSNSEVKEVTVDSIPEISPIKLSAIGTLGGTVSGATGLGGGAILTPILIEVVKVPIKFIPAHNNIVKVCAAVVGIIQALRYETPTNLPYAEYCFGHVNLMIVGIIFIGSNVGIGLGIHLMQKVKQRTAEILFSILLILVSSKIFYSTL